MVLPDFIIKLQVINKLVEYTGNRTAKIYEVTAISSIRGAPVLSALI